MSKLYLYDGPVNRFGKCVMNNYQAYTYAVSKKQAENFIKSRWKKEHGYLQSANVELPGEVQEIETKGEN